MRKALPVVADCEGCGVCCREQATLPVSWYLGVYKFGDPTTLPPDLLAGLEALRDEYLAGNFPPDGTPCVWYDTATKRCKHHEHRPRLCHDLKVGEDDCLRWRRKYGVDPTVRYGLAGGKVTRAVR